MTDQITVSRELLRHVVDDLMSINPGNMTPMAEEIWLKSTRSLIAALEQSVLEPVNINQIAAERYKVVEAHESLFHRWAVVAGNGAQQLYVGREVECQNMARKFAGAFLDGAWLASQHPAPQEQQSIGWLRAVDEEMTSTHLGVANITDSYEEAKKKLNSLICWHIDVSHDPKVNGTTQQPAEVPFLTDKEILEMADDGVFLGNVKEIARAVESAVRKKAGLK